MLLHNLYSNFLSFKETPNDLGKQTFANLSLYSLSENFIFSKCLFPFDLNFFHLYFSKIWTKDWNLRKSLTCVINLAFLKLTELKLKSKQVVGDTLYLEPLSHSLYAGLFGIVSLAAIAILPCSAFLFYLSMFSQSFDGYLAKRFCFVSVEELWCPRAKYVQKISTCRHFVQRISIFFLSYWWHTLCYCGSEVSSCHAEEPS